MTDTPDNPDPSRPPPYTLANYVTEESLGFLIHQVKVRLGQAIDEGIAHLDITTPQWAVLKEIARGEGETASALCRGSGCDTGSMTRMLDRLEEKGLIRRERSATDRRVVRLAATETGAALLPQILPQVVNALNTAVTDFSQDELDQLKKLLSRMAGNLDKRNT
jgi:DNA-binding MarR family transcriptional regulator